nr:uncharacterized protein LOC131797121 [Pocillopora verrucosa]XP_058970726.1 uncharacterized protein LOC131797121 [Pocillopora verrucosa]XP_058970727.1 uncharacterized protein LOC131797121 [Pocillopora verrucosa]
MDINAQKTKIPSKETLGDCLQKASSLLSVAAILMTVSLFVRSETNTKMLDSKFTLEIQEMGDALESMRAACQVLREDRDISNGRKQDVTIVRRSLRTNRSDSVNQAEADTGFRKYVTSIVTESIGTYCLSPGKFCVAGPRGPRGIPGNRGKRGPRGSKGKTGEKGKPGMKGDVGNPGMKGEEGDRGVPGHPGPKGEPGQSISAPNVYVSPASHTITENQTATFSCSADGNPKPRVTWSKMSGAGQVNINSHDNTLQIINVAYNDSGSYVCVATSILGKAQKTVKLTVEAPPRFIHTPQRLTKVPANSVASIRCRAFGFPPPTIVWSRGFVPLPQGRTTIAKNGTLIIANFGPLDSGTYQCKASNKLGSVSVLTTLNYDEQAPQIASTILAGNLVYESILRQFLKPAVGSHPRWLLCYRASSHGWAASIFHRRCDGKRNTVSIIRVGQYVFGGYTDVPWESSGRWTGTSKAFIFSLRNKEGLAPFKSLVTTPKYAIYRSSSNGLTFGRGHDIVIRDNANSNTNSYTFFGDSYSIPSGIKDQKTILAGTYSFTPDEVEVFYLG